MQALWYAARVSRLAKAAQLPSALSAGLHDHSPLITFFKTKLFITAQVLVCKVDCHEYMKGRTTMSYSAPFGMGSPAEERNRSTKVVKMS
jgi:hypothetical protein